MLIKSATDIRPSQISDESVYLRRRELLKSLGLGAVGLGLGASAGAQEGPELPDLKRPTGFDSNEELTSYEDVTTYNNYYEFGTGKSDPAENAGAFKPRPWTLQVSGEADNTGPFDLDDFIAPHLAQGLATPT